MKAYNASSQFSANEQFLAIMRLKVQEIEEKVKSSRRREQELILNNNVLNSEINQLKQERDALYTSLKMQKLKYYKTSTLSFISSI